MRPRTERTLDGLRYAPGTRFRITKEGARLHGFTPSGPSSFDGWTQQLHIGDVLTCTGFGPGWGGDPGYGIEFSTERSRADGALHCDVSPRRGGVWNYRPDPSFLQAVDTTDTTHTPE